MKCESFYANISVGIAIVPIMFMQQFLRLFHILLSVISALKIFCGVLRAIDVGTVMERHFFEVWISKYGDTLIFILCTIVFPMKNSSG